MAKEKEKGKKEPLGEKLVEHKIITPEQLDIGIKLEAPEIAAEDIEKLAEDATVIMPEEE